MRCKTPSAFTTFNVSLPCCSVGSRRLCNTFDMCVGPAALQGCEGANVSFSASLFVFAHILNDSHAIRALRLHIKAGRCCTRHNFSKRGERKTPEIDCAEGERMSASIFLNGTSTYLRIHDACYEAMESIALGCVFNLKKFHCKPEQAVQACSVCTFIFNKLKKKYQ